MSDMRAIRGRWRLANEPSMEGVPGTLTLSDDEFRLDLEDTLLADPALKRKVFDLRSPVPVDRILGQTTDGKDVTLDSCDLAGSRTQWLRDRESRQYESYWPRVVCIGGWFDADEALAFDKVFVRLSSLHAWTAVSGFDPMWQMHPLGAETVTQIYTPPQERQAVLSDGTVIKLSFPLRERTEGLYTFQKTLTQATRFMFEFPEPREVKDVQTLVFTLRNFLTLAVGEGVKVTELVGYREPLPTEQPPIGREVELIYEQLENPRARELPNHHHMLFVLDDVAERFQEHMVRWFERMPKLGRVLDLYFSTLHAEFVYLDTRFMNFVQAIEGYHRRRLNREMYDEATFASYRDVILEGVSGRARSLAKKVLKHANEISLEDRITDVLQLLGDPATRIATAGRMTPRDFAKRAAGIRNVYAHNLQNEEPEHAELVAFTYQLQALVEALLLHEAGFEPRAIDKMFQDARRYQLIDAMTDRL